MLPVEIPFPPMEARAALKLPAGAGWQYEPKWDGFRCLAFRDGARVELTSKAEKPLTRYFPELVAALTALRPQRFVLDGELVVPSAEGVSFDALLQRIHPAASRVARLARETPAIFVAFDLLVDERGRSLLDVPLAERRSALEAFAARHLRGHAALHLSPRTDDLETARRWTHELEGGLDGVIAKRLDASYEPGERSGAMRKIKSLRSADCVVGGFRYRSDDPGTVGSLLLGLYDADGLLHHVGFTSSLDAAARREVTPRLERRIEPPGFTGGAPGGPSRWTRGRSTEWQPLRPELVVEVQYDHFTGGRFRHGTKLLRWRPDKAPRQCTLEQVAQEARSPLDLLETR